jgi:hypothetical protein
LRHVARNHPQWLLSDFDGQANIHLAARQNGSRTVTSAATSNVRVDAIDGWSMYDWTRFPKPGASSAWNAVSQVL